MCMAEIDLEDQSMEGTQRSSDFFVDGKKFFHVHEINV